MKIAVFDYGAGNLHSLCKALEGDDRIVSVEVDPLRAIEADVLVLPGVGSFASAVERLIPGRDAMRNAISGGLPAIGICLGMQLLFSESEEGAGTGLGAIPGRVTRLVASRVPQIGWNEVTPETVEDPLFTAAPLRMAYFANSYVCRPDDESVIIAWSTHEGERFPAAVRSRNTVGVQFHPEKSSRSGVQFLQTFLLEAAATRGGS